MKCDDSQLIAMLQAPMAAEVSPETLSHLETCPNCQHRLEVLAADQQWWSDVSESLSDENWEPISRQPDASVVIALEPTLPDELPAVCDTVTLDFLDSPRHPDLLGRLGRYDIERVLGNGGMGIVLKAFDSELHRYVAIKVLAPHLAGIGAARQRFAREAQAAAAIADRHVMPIHDVQSEAAHPYLVMPLVAGQSLQTRVDAAGPLTVEEALGVLRQTAQALAAAHTQGIVHRDVKPANILMEEGGRVLLSDFGLARAVDEAGMTRTGVIAGTPHYMAPEQALGEPADARSDLYSLGAVMYFMLTGRPPHIKGGAMAILHAICHQSHVPVGSRRDNLSDEVAALCESLLAKEPSRRPHAAEAVCAIADQLIRQRKFHRAVRPTKPEPARTSRRLPHSLTLGLCALALGLLIWGVVNREHLVGRFTADAKAPSTRTPTEQEANQPLAIVGAIAWDDDGHQSLDEALAAASTSAMEEPNLPGDAASEPSVWWEELQATASVATNVEQPAGSVPNAGHSGDATAGKMAEATELADQLEALFQNDISSGELLSGPEHLPPLESLPSANGR